MKKSIVGKLSNFVLLIYVIIHYIYIRFSEDTNTTFFC